MFSGHANKCLQLQEKLCSFFSFEMGGVDNLAPMWDYGYREGYRDIEIDI